MSGKDYYASGDWNAQCWECGRKHKASELKKHWQGYYVCSRCWEPRHPQDFVRATKDVQTPDWVQPWPQDNFVVVCTPNGQSAIPNMAVPNCAVPDFISPFYDPDVIDL